MKRSKQTCPVAEDRGRAVLRVCRIRGQVRRFEGRERCQVKKGAAWGVNVIGWGKAKERFILGSVAIWKMVESHTLEMKKCKIV